jgi:hypothetical protein
VLVLFARSYAVGRIKYGSVTDKLGNSQPFSVIKIFDEKTNSMVARTVADEKGRYFMILDEGLYVAQATSLNNRVSSQKHFSFSKRDAWSDKLVIE